MESGELSSFLHFPHHRKKSKHTASFLSFLLAAARGQRLLKCANFLSFRAAIAARNRRIRNGGATWFAASGAAELLFDGGNETWPFAPASRPIG